ncbi:hypothetical protein KW849_29040 [Pseudomonas sp. PDM26]|uniref:hypothetical protein n=1 Tax=Pseudomonas sp. PDM26 TaxID=2854766 RepID=UPI001C441841|nr:hypothetical protein [Pseudomonas sp. PDM26]MBV7550329.1 hypothetical protein [Pseudomonas sp. PDM26]
MTGQLTETSEKSDTSLLLYLDELPELVEKTVKFSGRCEAVRQLGGLTFLRVASQYFSLQVIVLDSTLRNATAEIRQGDFISVNGLLRTRPDALERPASPRIDPNKYEVVLQQFSIILQSQKIDLLTEKDAKSRHSLRHIYHQASQLISLIKLYLEQQGFVQLHAPSSTDFHEQQRVRELTALSDNSLFSSPLFSAYTTEQLMHGTQRFYFFVEGTGALPDLLHIVIAHHEPGLHAHEDLLTAITGHIIELLAPDIHLELDEAASRWQDLILHTQPSPRISSSYNGSFPLQPLANAKNGKRIAIRRRLQGARETSGSIATAMSLPLGPLKEVLEATNPAKKPKPPAHEVLADMDAENSAAYEAYSKLESEHQMLLVERSLRAFNPYQDLAAARCSSQAALRYMEPALHHYGIDPAMAQRFLSLQARLHGNSSTAVCPIALFQLLWTVLGNPSAKLLLQSNTSRDRLLFTFVNQRILTDIHQLVFIHPSAIDALESLLERIRDKDTLGRLRTLLRNVIAKTPTELATLLTTLAAMEPASANAAIAETKKLENAVKHGFTTPYWMSLCLGCEDLDPLINALRSSNLQSSQRILGNNPVFSPISGNSLNRVDCITVGDHERLPLAETIYTLFRPVTAGISELENTLSELQDYCAHIERARLNNFNLNFIPHLYCYRYIIYQRRQFHDQIRIYLSKNAASFFAKSTTGICTDINRELFKRTDHFHLNIFSERLGKVIGNVQLYTLSIHNENALLIRGINPTKNYSTVCLADELLDCVIACAEDLATENNFSLVCVAEQNGLWNSNSNRPEIRAALAKRVAHQGPIVLEDPFMLYNHYTTEIYISSVYPLWRNPR